MRAKTIKRNVSDLTARLDKLKKELSERPTSKLRVLNFVIKEVALKSDPLENVI